MVSLKLAGWQGLFKWINPLKQFDPLYKTMLGHNNKVRGPTILDLKEKIHSSSLGRDANECLMNGECHAPCRALNDKAVLNGRW